MERNKQGHIMVDQQDIPETRDGVAIVFNQETFDDATNKIANKEIDGFEVTASGEIAPMAVFELATQLVIKSGMMIDSRDCNDHYEIRAFEV